MVATTERTTVTPMSPPAGPSEWTLAQVQQALSRPLPESMIETRKQGGQQLKYIPWHTANKILDKYAPGWTWEIRSIHTTPDRLFITGRLTIPCSDGVFFREATGTEALKEEKPVVIDRNPLKDEFGRTVMEPKELAYGDPSSNAESMCFRRAAARFGLGLYLY